MSHEERRKGERRQQDDVGSCSDRYCPGHYKGFNDRRESERRGATVPPAAPRPSLAEELAEKYGFMECRIGGVVIPTAARFPEDKSVLAAGFRLAINEAIERCAELAETEPLSEPIPDDPERMHKCFGPKVMRTRIAARIRALKEKA